MNPALHAKIMRQTGVGWKWKRLPCSRGATFLVACLGTPIPSRVRSMHHAHGDMARVCPLLTACFLSRLNALESENKQLRSEQQSESPSEPHLSPSLEEGWQDAAHLEESPSLFQSPASSSWLFSAPDWTSRPGPQRKRSKSKQAEERI